MLFLRDGRSDVLDEVGDEEGFESSGLDVELSSQLQAESAKGDTIRKERGREEEGETRLTWTRLKSASCLNAAQTGLEKLETCSC